MLIIAAVILISGCIPQPVCINGDRYIREPIFGEVPIYRDGRLITQIEIIGYRYSPDYRAWRK